MINLTPDSFSDPAKHLDSSSLSKTLNHFRAHNVGVLDIGAESTAPMNSEVGEKGEWERLENYFFKHPLFDEFLKFDLSLDSFRAETAKKFFERVRSFNPQGRLIWNDVSGVFDASVLEIVEKFSVSYIYCHNEVSSRDSVFSHAKLRGVGDIFERALLDATKIKDTFECAGFGDRFIFDPCFGFSKSPEENYELMKRSAELINKLDASVMIGISHKSFLRSLIPDRESLSAQELNAQTDVLQSIYFSQLLTDPLIKDSQTEIFLRLHDPASFTLSNRAQIFLK